MISPLQANWSSGHRAYSNNPERFSSIDGSVETWSREITSAVDLPVECAALLPGLFETFPYCVRTPALQHHRSSEPESFLFLAGSNLVIMKRTRAGVSLFRSDLRAIDGLATETSLLQSCLTFYPRDGQPQRVPFNTVVEDLFAPVIAAYLKTRGTTVHETAQLRAVQPDPFDDLLARDYKYHAYAFNVLPEDEARSRFYHPTRTVPHLLNWSRLIPSYLLVASGSMLYCFSERAPFRSRGRVNHSMVVRYIPLESDFTVSYRPVKGENRYRMVLLQGGTTALALPLARDAEAEFAVFAGAARLPTLSAVAGGRELDEAWGRKVG